MHFRLDQTGVLFGSTGIAKLDYVLVLADKATNNVIVVCKKYYIDTLLGDLREKSFKIA